MTEKIVSVMEREYPMPERNFVVCIGDRVCGRDLPDIVNRLELQRQLENFFQKKAVIFDLDKQGAILINSGKIYNEEA